MDDTTIDLARILIRHLPVCGDVTEVEFLDKGYSTDRKYVLHSGDAARHLLRVSDIGKQQVRRADFESVSQLWHKGVACPQPLHFGVDEAFGVCFTLLTYVEGECAEDHMPQLTSSEQRGIGMQAGEELKRIHEALTPAMRSDDFTTKGEKYAASERAVRELGGSFKGQDAAGEYVEAKLSLLRDRPTAFRHGDYHPGNLIVRGSKLAGVIDFNRCDWGDPIDDFYKVALFGAPLSEEYAQGQIRGYFGGDPPQDFWPLYNLYVAIVLPADIVWTRRHWPRHLADSLRVIELITSTHDFEGGGPPTWWTSPSVTD